ncbi:hypothetical protein PRIPAC_78566 [Pristionchus pacificus]|uniref:Transmembrane ion channel n=1 Tax=Pristionchus pacificus TaxID=54126 RepID=A0A2A6CQB4_PRIPA|nr:hypothetical protein PRIPAC_78566 [Pristionchus pacificus]|eukprot:PDM80405.1 transmembrane ion channel [Pristionchus pacificus]
MNTTVDYMSILRGLKADLLHNYDSQLAVVNHSGSFFSGDEGEGFAEKFAMMLTYAKLTDVHEQSMEFSIVIGMLLMWTDARLVWDPARYNGISHIIMRCSCVSKRGHSNDHTSRSHTSLFPFDVQKCNLCFVLNGYDSDEFKFSATLGDNALSTAMSEWRLNIENITTSVDKCTHDICLYFPITLSRNPQFWIGLVIVPIFMLGFLILIGLFYSGQEDLVNNAIGFGLETMMSMMVVVGILNDSLSKIESIPALGLFVLVQIAVTSAAVITVMLTDKLRRTISEEAHGKGHRHSRSWRFIRSITDSEYVLRNFLFVIFSILHISNLIWLMSYQARVSTFYSQFGKLQDNASVSSIAAFPEETITANLLSA